MGDLSKNFSRDEFGGDMSLSFIKMLQSARAHYGPIFITSGVRSADHNEAIGGVKDSAHVPVDLDDGEGLCGHAADLAVKNSVDRYDLVRILMEAGFMRIGVAKDFVHVDNDSRKPQGVLWTY